MKYQDARYSKGSFVAFPEIKGELKSKEAWLLEALNGRYSGRYKGYVLPDSKRAILEALLEKGWGCRRRITNRCPSVFISLEGEEMTLSNAKKLLLPP